MIPKGTVRLSVQIVTWNSARVIDCCLASLAGQGRRDFETIVVDNASEDRSADQVAAWMGRGIRGRLIRAPSNEGFCAGQNRALAASSGDLVLFLNPDAVLPPDFVAAAITAADARPPEVGSIAPRILLPDGRLDSAGLRLDRFRRVYDRGRGEPAEGRYLHEEDVFGCTGAVALHRRRMLRDVALNGEVLDGRLFAYCEDMDLSWRAALRGWRCRYVPELVATHRREARNALRRLPGRGVGARHQALTVCNRILVIAKCERAATLLPALAWLLPFEAARIAYLAVRAPGALRGYVRAFGLLPRALADRRAIRAGQRDPDHASGCGRSVSP